MTQDSLNLPVESHGVQDIPVLFVANQSFLE
jgi:hypothetical protein